MNLQDFNFPSISDGNLAIPNFDTIPELLDEAKKRGYYNGRTPYNKLFRTLLYHGGEVVPKEDVDEAYWGKAWPYCKALMRSFAPKYEEKEAVCAMLMSELIQPHAD